MLNGHCGRMPPEYNPRGFHRHDTFQVSETGSPVTYRMQSRQAGRASCVHCNTRPIQIKIIRNPVRLQRHGVCMKRSRTLESQAMRSPAKRWVSSPVDHTPTTNCNTRPIQIKIIRNPVRLQRHGGSGGSIHGDSGRTMRSPAKRWVSSPVDHTPTTKSTTREMRPLSPCTRALHTHIREKFVAADPLIVPLGV
jgi:hypothetical protein